MYHRMPSKVELEDSISCALERLNSPFSPARITLAQILLQLRSQQTKIVAGKRPRKQRVARPKSDYQLIVSQLGGKHLGMVPKQQPSADDGPCNCKKSKCLKLYCQCFAGGRMCNGCNCNNCLNQEATNDQRQEALKALLERNPTAFESKVRFDHAAQGKNAVAHRFGCRCKKSECLKNYCECHSLGMKCGAHCSCVGCKNNELLSR